MTQTLARKASEEGKITFKGRLEKTQRQARTG
jgi:hypothetical protein